MQNPSFSPKSRSLRLCDHRKVLPSEVVLQYLSNAENNAPAPLCVCPALFVFCKWLPSFKVRTWIIEYDQVSAAGGTYDVLDLNRRFVSVAVS